MINHWKNNNESKLFQIIENIVENEIIRSKCNSNPLHIGSILLYKL